MNTELSAELRIMRQIILDAKGFSDPAPEVGDLETQEQIQETWDRLEEEGYLGDPKYEFRCSGEETKVNRPEQWSRHYESEEVGKKLDDGTWVGWTYWHGGGKHGEPEAIDWMGESYDLDVAEEEKLVVVRTFSKRP